MKATIYKAIIAKVLQENATRPQCWQVDLDGLVLLQEDYTSIGLFLIFADNLTPPNRIALGSDLLLGKDKQLCGLVLYMAQDRILTLELFVYDGLWNKEYEDTIEFIG